jgi:uncharacterized protein
MPILESPTPTDIETHRTSLEVPSKEPRIPHLGHVALFLAVLCVGLLFAAFCAAGAVYFHLFGVSTLKESEHSAVYVVLMGVISYAMAFALAVPICRRLWHRSFRSGIQWNPVSRRTAERLIALGFVCFLAALLSRAVFGLPHPSPFTEMINSRTAAWVMFGFAFLVAPFCEEVTFRGMMLPATCTAIEWLTEKVQHRKRLPLGENGEPRWSPVSLAGGVLSTSIFFALTHWKQTESLGPICLLFCVGILLSIVRLKTRSVMASTIVHMTYNFMVFFVMFAGTHGFQNLR